ncbi:hypothetical protein HYH03_014338 [Edaphochlamys debaryana]|uniref:Uncharacterized protein n=1 Tax=Edaphochlamys debaryana TaxID=47281 RepID=A0A835XU63_9CHLO|nr:hypothetical protein HYH03_014338 [Edaphochlamys debaryana]|eukprot:KAG2486965.1 hypothetical protein HYH03_014338 [Edaphochlamys debaryana]
MASPSQFRRVEGNYNFAPDVRSLRQVVDKRPLVVVLCELVDNALDATVSRPNPHIAIRVDLTPDGRDATLEVEDNGKGMGKEQLTDYHVLGRTGSHVPKLPRDQLSGPLPLECFINRKLNRFGRGSAACVAFGDLVEVESYEAPASPDQPKPECRHMFRLNYRKAQELNTWGNEACTGLYEDDAGPEEESYTIIRIQQLLPDRLRDLSNTAFLDALAQDLHHVYYFFIHGFPEALWAQLPPELTRSSRRPAGGCLEGSAASRSRSRPHGGRAFEATLSPANTPDAEKYASDLHRLLTDRERRAGANKLLRVAVGCHRYIPAGHSPPTKGPANNGAGPSGSTGPSGPSGPSGRGGGGGAGPSGGGPAGRGAGGGGGAPNGATPATQRRGPAAGAAAAKGGGGGGGGGGRGAAQRGPIVIDSSEEGEEVEVEEEDAEGGGPDVIDLVDEKDGEPDIDSRPHDSPCDVIAVYAYFPHCAADNQRSKPKRRDNTEICVVPCWSGKVMTKRELADRFPAVHEEAVRLATRMQATQKHAHKLGDRGRLLLLLMVSPDAQAHEHKADLEGPAYDLFKLMGPRSQQPTPATSPRLYTYLWPAATLGPAAAVGATDAAGPSGRAASPTATAATAPPLPPRSRKSTGGGKAARTSGAAGLTTPAVNGPAALSNGAGTSAAAAAGGGAGAAGVAAAAGPREGLAAAMAAVGSGGGEWREDCEMGWGALQLVEAFRTWLLLDKDGCLVKSTLGCLRELDPPLQPPLGFDLEGEDFSDMLEHSRAFSFAGVPGADAKKDTEDLTAGELMFQAEAGKVQHGCAAEAGGARDGRTMPRLAGNARSVELFYLRGSDLARQLFVLARPWRPRWAPLGPLLSISFMELAPVVAQYIGTRTASRLSEAQRVCGQWEAFLPHHIALLPGEQHQGSPLYNCASLVTVYVTNQTLSGTSLKGTAVGPPDREGAACLSAGAPDTATEAVTIYSMNRQGAADIKVFFTSNVWVTQVGILVASCQQGYIQANLSLIQTNGSLVVTNCPQDTCTTSNCLGATTAYWYLCDFTGNLQNVIGVLFTVGRNPTGVTDWVVIDAPLAAAQPAAAAEPQPTASRSTFTTLAAQPPASDPSNVSAAAQSAAPQPSDQPPAAQPSATDPTALPAAAATGAAQPTIAHSPAQPCTS